jgi:hypothetical protein
MWEMAKGWLDPRTQQKVEIMKTGPDQEARLKCFISEMNLPSNYGGIALPLYKKRLHTEYVYVNRYSAIRKFIFVPIGYKLIVDSYMKDGDLLCEIYSSTSPLSTTLDYKLMEMGGYPTTYDHIGYADVNKFVMIHHQQQHSQTSFRCLYKQEIKGMGGHLPTRFLQSYIAEQEDLHIVLFYSNSARFVQRALIFNLYTEPIQSSAGSATATAAVIEDSIGEAACIPSTTPKNEVDETAAQILAARLGDVQVEVTSTVADSTTNDEA